MTDSNQLLIECEHCHEDVPEGEIESMIVHIHRVEGRGVGADYMDVCLRCREGGE